MSTVSSAVEAAASATKNSWYNTAEIEDHFNKEFFGYQAEVRESMLAFLTPLNLTIFVLLLSILYYRSRTPEAITLDPTRPVTFRTFTPRTLLRHNGTKNEMNPSSSVYLAVQGKVYDVSSGRNFYGPGGPYENFAGRDATRGLACQSFDEEMLTKNLDGPLDTCEDLKPEELENLRGWVERFDEKYLIVGKLVAFSSGRSEF